MSVRECNPFGLIRGEIEFGMQQLNGDSLD